MLYSYDPPVSKLRIGFRERLSALFTQMRVQRKRWNEREAWMAAGLSNTTLSGIESPTGNPKIESIATYARALGYEPEDFFAAAAHPESEDAFGHPDVQKFIRVWKTLKPDDREGLMRAVSGYERLMQPSQPVAPEHPIAHRMEAPDTPVTPRKVRPRG